MIESYYKRAFGSPILGFVNPYNDANRIDENELTGVLSQKYALIFLDSLLKDINEKRETIIEKIDF